VAPRYDAHLAAVTDYHLTLDALPRPVWLDHPDYRLAEPWDVEEFPSLRDQARQDTPPPLPGTGCSSPRLSLRACDVAVLLDHDDSRCCSTSSRRLHADGVTAAIRIVGGAAIALMNSDRRSTADIDAVLLPATSVRAVAATMAAEGDLPADWLNDATLAHIPLVGLDDWNEIFRVGGVCVGSVQMLLAMKLRASRGRRDTEAIGCLLQRCEVTFLDDAPGAL